MSEEMSSVRIGPAEEDQLPALAALLGVLFEQEAEFRPDRQRQLAGLRAIHERPALGTVLVAREGAEVVGMVVVLHTVSTALGAPAAILEDLVVSPGRRGRGIGSALVRAAVAHAREQGCARITLLTDADNRDAARLYARHGFRGSPMVPMRLRLE